ncbi:MAG: PASTA domain-containing protein [Lachnospiraceae bacterium]|nr:PASTA domain-containing protein [Lachnospiraceae bacterium]
MLSIHKTKLIAAILLILTGIFFAGCAGENPAVGSEAETAVSTARGTVPETTAEKETEPLSVPVPFVEGITAEEARNALIQAGLADPIMSREYSETVPKGQVISQNVPAGTVLTRGSVISLTISRGPEPFELPDLRGWEAAAAKAVLDAKGITVSFDYVIDPDVSEDVVLTQDLPAGSILYQGDAVRLTVSEKEPLREVADAAGLSKEAAEALLRGQGFTVQAEEEYDQRVPAGCVISQQPAAGSLQDPGTQITILISRGPKPTQPVPTQPKPTQPAPTQPAVTEPEPTQPVPTTAETPPVTEKAYTSYHFRSSKLLNEHYQKHGIEMGFKSAAAYEKAASDVINNPNALSKREKEDNDWVFYIVATNEFVVLSTDGYIRTYFLPNAGKAYYDRQ